MSKEEEPLRPKPTLLFFCALGLWAGVAATLSSALSFSTSLLIFFAIAAILLGMLAGFHSLRSPSGKVRVICMVVLGLVSGLLCGQFCVYSSQSKQEKIEQIQGSSSYLFEITEDERSNDFGSSCIAKTQVFEGEEIHVRLRFKDGSEPLFFGQRIRAKVNIKRPPDGSASYLWAKGVIATADIYSFEKVSRNDAFGSLTALREKALGLLSEKGTGTSLLRAILFGERSKLEEGGLYQSIRAVGLAHLVAVSGSHLVIVSASLVIFLRFLKVPKPIAILIQLLFLICYLVLTAMPISALRAAFMAFVALLSFFSRRRAASLNTLSVCILIILIINPWSAISISFVLSALSTLGIVVLSGLFRTWTQRFLPILPASFHESISLTLAASILMVPLVASLFSQVSLISPLMNIVAVPVFTFLCVAGLCAIVFSLIAPPFGQVLLDALIEASLAFCNFISHVSDIPYVSVPASADLIVALVFGAGLLISLWSFWPQPSKLNYIKAGALGTFLFCLAIFFLPNAHSDEVIMLDVGQGDSFLVRSNGSNVLIDTGNSDASLLQALGRHGIFHLDALVVTHPDDDHCGSLSSLQSLVEVDQVCVAAETLTCGCNSCTKLIHQAEGLVGTSQLQPLVVGDRMIVGSFELTVIWPDSFRDKGGNEDSLSLLMAWSPKVSEQIDEDESLKPTMLFCGDAESDQVMEMVSKRRLGPLSILKVGHHGSKNAVDSELAAILHPEIALVSVGSNNRYGHPTQETLSALEGVGAHVFRTDEEGDVICEFKYGRLDVTVLG